MTFLQLSFHHSWQQLIKPTSTLKWDLGAERVTSGWCFCTGFREWRKPQLWLQQMSSEATLKMLAGVISILFASQQIYDTVPDKGYVPELGLELRASDYLPRAPPQYYFLPKRPLEWKQQVQEVQFSLVWFSLGVAEAKLKPSRPPWGQCSLPQGMGEESLASNIRGMESVHLMMVWLTVFPAVCIIEQKQNTFSCNLLQLGNFDSWAGNIRLDIV